MSNKRLPKRNEVPVNDTWDLSPMFENDQAWESEYNNLKEYYPVISRFKGRLSSSADALLEALKVSESISSRLEVLYIYAHLNNDADTANNHYQGYMSKMGALVAEIGAELSFINTELMAADEDIIRGYINTTEELKIYKHSFNELFSKRKHILSEEVETVLAQSSEVLGMSSDIFSVLNNADLKFDNIKDENGESVQLSHGRYGLYMENYNRDVRKDAFKTLYKSYTDHINTFATTLRGQVKYDNLNAKLRKYSSAREASLSRNFVPETVYDALVEAVDSNLNLLHRYVSLRKRALKLEDIHMYDIYVPFVEPVELTFTYEEAKQLVFDSLAVLGKEYQSILRKAFDQRWIDVVENEGKRSGAYSSGSYDTNPYILLNWNNTLDNVYTLTHELGHSLHSYYTRNNQPFVYGDYSIFLAEVASTTNENLLTDYLLKKYDDPKIQAYIINHYLDGFKATVFRQTQFAEFEHLIHTLDDQGVALTAELLKEKYFEINKKYYGDEMVYDDEIAIEWSRIPHFYYNYYVFQYATGFSAATALSHKILTEGESAVVAYINYLKSGCSDFPIEVLKKAGVDMSTNKATIDAMKVFDERLKMLEEIL